MAAPRFTTAIAYLVPAEVVELRTALATLTGLSDVDDLGLERRLPQIAAASTSLLTTCDRLTAAIDERENSETARLRAALEHIAIYGSRNGDLMIDHADAMRNIARNTLRAGR
ncbi:MAG TPA: hypothetical protein VF533_17460 [Solirubrobacteraceae bacterium]|jgi:hypothetical protein